MAKEIIKDPQIFITKEARELFDNIKRSFTEFRQFDNKDFFMLAVMFGYENGVKKPLKPADTEKSGFARERYLLDTDNAVLKAIAISEKKDLEVIGDIKTIYAIAEEYANGGIKFLKEFVFDNPASFVKKYAVMLEEIYDRKAK